jgi:hypothetical protein
MTGQGSAIKNGLAGRWCGRNPKEKGNHQNFYSRRAGKSPSFAENHRHVGINFMHATTL